MSKPDFATQWEALAARIAHIERLAVAGLGLFWIVLGYAMQQQISTSRQFWVVAIFLGGLSLSYLHLMFILAVHARHIVSLERASDGVFYVFRRIFERIPRAFYVGYAICTITPAVATAGVAIYYSEHAGLLPAATYVLSVLAIAIFIMVAVVRMLVGLRGEIAKERAGKRSA